MNELKTFCVWMEGFGTVVIRAKDAQAALKCIVECWNLELYDRDFSVTVAYGFSDMRDGNCEKAD